MLKSLILIYIAILFTVIIIFIDKTKIIKRSDHQLDKENLFLLLKNISFNYSKYYNISTKNLVFGYKESNREYLNLKIYFLEESKDVLMVKFNLGILKHETVSFKFPINKHELGLKIIKNNVYIKSLDTNLNFELNFDKKNLFNKNYNDNLKLILYSKDFLKLKISNLDKKIIFEKYMIINFHNQLILCIIFIFNWYIILILLKYTFIDVLFDYYLWVIVFGNFIYVLYKLFYLIFKINKNNLVICLSMYLVILMLIFTYFIIKYLLIFDKKYNKIIIFSILFLLVFNFLNFNTYIIINSVLLLYQETIYFKKNINEGENDEMMNFLMVIFYIFIFFYVPIYIFFDINFYLLIGNFFLKAIYFFIFELYIKYNLYKRKNKLEILKIFNVSLN